MKTAEHADGWGTAEVAPSPNHRKGPAPQPPPHCSPLLHPGRKQSGAQSDKKYEEKSLYYTFQNDRIYKQKLSTYFCYLVFLCCQLCIFYIG